MRKLTHIPLLALAAACAAGASAQNTLTIAGHTLPCAPELDGQSVTITVIGASGTVSGTAVMNMNCYYTLDLSVPDTAGLVVVSGHCGSGTTTADTVTYAGNSSVIANLWCMTPPDPCTACYTFTQVAPMVATFSASCSSGGWGALQYSWNFSTGPIQNGATITKQFPGPGAYPVCLHMTDQNGCSDQLCQTVYVHDNGDISLDPPVDCAACINVQHVMQNGAPLPYVVNFSSCSTAGTDAALEWTTPSGSTLTDAEFLWQFTSAGPHFVCLTIASAGCTSTVCDTVVFDSTGMLTNAPIWYDCLGELWGDNVPGTSCTTVDGEPGTWSASCDCAPDNAVPCEAGYWVIQAYQENDGEIEPIPFELWVLNTSSGGTGNFQFHWDFGDGTTSIEPFPTHVYPGPGPYLLCLTIADDAGCFDMYCDTVSVGDDGLLGMVPGGDGEVRSVLTIRVVQEAPTGIGEPPGLQAGGLWPNPVRDRLNLQLFSSRSGNVELMVLGLDGRTLHTARTSLVSGQNQLDLDVHNLSAGVYLLRITDGRNTATMRFVKQ